MLGWLEGHPYIGHTIIHGAGRSGGIELVAAEP